MRDKLSILASHPRDRLAYIYGNDTLTYGSLWDQASAAANSLRRQGFSPVILYGHKQPDMVIAMVACLMAERTYVPVEAGTPSVRILSILEATGSDLILSPVALELPDIACCSLSQLSRFDTAPATMPQSDIAYMIFTSGSTGAPKGVPIPRSNLAHFSGWVGSLPALKDFTHARVLNQASFSFDLSVADLYYSLVSGHTLVAVPPSDNQNAAVFQAMQEHRINVAVVTPTFMKLCLLDRDFNENRYPDFSCVYFCGEPLEKQTVRKLFRAFPHIRVINAYGPTEATSAVSAIEITPAMLEVEGPLPVGDGSFFATDIEICDDEIVLKGPSVFRGYLGGHVGGWFQENGINCYHTGDLGYLKDGLLYCKGRRDHQIKFKGYRIELADIEENLRRLPGIEDCAAVAVRTADGVVKSIKAFVIGVGGLDLDGIRTQLASRVPFYMVPRTIKQLERFPVNQNGKTDRKALEQL